MKIRLYDPSERVEFLDVIKGFGILLLLLSHSISGESLLKTWIFSFHMPLFFWCSGYLIAIKYPNGKELQGKLGRLLAKKALSILIPYIVFSLLIVVFCVLLELLHSHTFDSSTIISYLVRILQLKGMESLWFLPCLLLAEILFFVLYSTLPQWTLGIVCIVSVGLNFLFNGDLPVGISGSLIRSTTGFVFICFGYWTFQLGNIYTFKKGQICLSLLLMLFGAALSFTNGFAAIGSYEFGFVPTYYISAFLTLMGLYGLCRSLPSMQVIPFYGKNSIVILCTNNLIIEILRLFDSKVTGNFFLQHGMLGNFLFTILLVICELPVIVVGMKYFRYLFGVFSK